MNCLDKINNWYIKTPELVYSGQDIWTIMGLHETGQVIQLSENDGAFETIKQLKLLNLLDDEVDPLDIELDGDENTIYVTDVIYSRPIVMLVRALENNVRIKKN